MLLAVQCHKRMGAGAIIAAIDTPLSLVSQPIAKVRCKNSKGNLFSDAQMYIQKYPFSIGILVRIYLKCMVGILTELGFQHKLKFIKDLINHLSLLNIELNLFDEIIPLPHPRWVMQYRRKSINKIFTDITKKLLIP